MAYLAIPTTLGKSKHATAAAGGTSINYIQMAVGDGGGSPITPNAGMTALVNEKYRAAISYAYVKPAHPDTVIYELRIPTTSGGYTIREVGIFDNTGALMVIASHPEQYKPAEGEGGAGETIIHVGVQYTDFSTVTVTFDEVASVTTLSFNDHVTNTTDAHGATSAATPSKFMSRDANGYTNVVTPATSDNSTKVATTAFMKAVYTANDVLAKLLTVDGSGSGLDADTCKGYGIGSYGGYYTVTDLNNYPVGSVGLVTPVTNTLTNSPISTSAGAIVTTIGYNDYVEQTLQNPVGMGDIWVRRKYNTTWGTWYKLAFTESPTFSGEPLSVTPAADDNTTKIATTAYVQGQASSSNPAMNGTVAIGTSKKWARADHVHPTDTSRLPASSYTANDVLAKLLTVDGSGSGVSADFVRGLPADFTSSAAANGYQKLPSGIIEQWGTVVFGDVTSGHTNGTATFTTAFPNAVYAVNISMICPDAGSINVPIGYAVYNVKTTGFSFVINEWGGLSQNINVVFRATGK